MKILGELPRRAGWDKRYSVEADSGNKYVISIRREPFTIGCSCKGWINHRHCKHVDTFRKQTMEQGSVPVVVTTQRSTIIARAMRTLKAHRH